MAELATIALVGNILQFLEVGIKLSATARRAYKSIDGCIKEDKDLLTDTGRNGQAAVDDSLVQAAKASDEYASELTTLLETMSMRPGVTRTLESLRVSARRILKNGDIHDLEAKMLESFKSLILKVKPNDKDSTVQMIGRLENLLTEAQRVKRQHSLLKSLLFHTIKQRHNAIPERHQDTFKWVFERDTYQFCEWLESESGFFWVKGKAGSGKSTLIKYLAAHSQTKSLLQVWGKGQRVVTASHFFWNAGTSMQKSISGLFQTILYQVIKTCPQLIDIIGNCRKDLSDSAISLTREDIRNYVKEELGANPNFQRLSRTDSRCSMISNNIVERAQGVFLWVILVVDYLRGGLRNNDDYSDLQRLNDLPDDLEEYFKYMLQTIEDVYWESTTRIFRTVIAAEQSLPLLGFSFLDQEMGDPGYAVAMQ
ncbi:hypothetical protein H9L39_16445 [Fusarium oxysporum f. sp. albedinis]|nr:hypothetical protein H9L39_16445 [Fusarium oxysporum f. sp. albedinis]